MAGFWKSVTSGFRPSGDEELGNPFINLNDEAQLQADFSQRTGSGSFADVIRASVPNMWSSDQPAPVMKNEGFLGNLRSTLTPSFLQQSEEDENAESTCCPNMSWKQRMFGCVCCVAIGQMFQFFAFWSVLGVLVGHPGRFASMYSMGNLFMVMSSFFLSGPRQQCKKLSGKDRRVSASVFLTTMLLTLKVVFGHAFLGRALVILILVMAQWLAQMWYILSYVPYGQSMGRRFVTKCASLCCAF